MSLQAGTGRTEINPQKSMFLCGYPHEERMSEGVNDSIYASTLLLDDNGQQLTIVSLDILMLSPARAKQYRRSVATHLAIQEANVFISCTHTHSAPISCPMLACGYDKVVPQVDDGYLDFIGEQIIASVEQAKTNLRDSQIAITSGAVDGVGCNRRDPEGPRDPEVGILAVRDRNSGEIFGMVMTYCMHPTVMHEDSKLVSSDFPGYARIHLTEKINDELVVVYQTGPEGNQSPRYHVKGQTFAESERLGCILGESVYQSCQELTDTDYQDSVKLKGALKKLSLDRRRLPSVAEAKKNLERCYRTYEDLKRANAGHGPVRTAECSTFGAEESYYLAQLQENGALEDFMKDYRTCEIQVVKIGDCFLVGWPGEVFIEYGLELKEKAGDRLFVACLVNGELQGYIVTEDAVKEGGYEATNAMFAPEVGRRFIGASLELIEGLKR